MVSMLVCLSRGKGSNPNNGRIWFEISTPCASSVNSAMMNTLALLCVWEDETVRERTRHPPSHAKASQIKSLTLHTHRSVRAGLRHCSSLIQNKNWFKYSEVLLSIGKEVMFKDITKCWNISV